MSILSSHAADCFTLLKRSLIQSDELPLVEILDDKLLKDTFEQEKVRFGVSDEDVFTPAVTLWAMLSQFLFSETGRTVKAAAGRVVSLYAQIDGRVVSQNAGNYCRAKAKIPVSALKKMTKDLAAQAECQMAERENLKTPMELDEAEDRKCPETIAAIRRRGVFGRIINVDGFTIDAPDTEENQKKYPQNPVQAKGLGFPILRCVGLISMMTGLLIDLATATYSGKGSGETTLLRQLKGSLRKGDLLVADSYYCSYWLIAMCKEIGVEVVMKNHHKRESHPIGAKQLSKSERITSWVRPPRPNWMTKKEYNKVPESISIRLCDQKIREAGSRCQSFTIATTMLDIEEHPAHWIRGLYRGRWLVETDIQWIKCTMGLEHLRSQNPEGIERELWAGLMTYNLVRVKMLQAGLTHTREARSLSFTETYQLLSTNWLLCACVGVSKPMKQASLLQSVCAVIGNRLGRIEPRENKRREKILKLMKIPRKLFKQRLAKLAKTA